MDREQRLSEIEDLLNPEGRLHERDVVRDAHPGSLGQLRKELGKEVQKSGYCGAASPAR